MGREQTGAPAVTGWQTTEGFVRSRMASVLPDEFRQQQCRSVEGGVMRGAAPHRGPVRPKDPWAEQRRRSGARFHALDPASQPSPPYPLADSACVTGELSDVANRFREVPEPPILEPSLVAKVPLLASHFLEISTRQLSPRFLSDAITPTLSFRCRMAKVWRNETPKRAGYGRESG